MRSLRDELVDEIVAVFEGMRGNIGRAVRTGKSDEEAMEMFRTEFREKVMEILLTKYREGRLRLPGIEEGLSEFALSFLRPDPKEARRG